MIKLKVILLSLCLTAISGAENITRTAKFFHHLLFHHSSVQVPPTVCSSQSGGNGTCYTAGNCTDRGGKADGSCAQGLGVCCTFTIGCGSTGRENNTLATSESLSLATVSSATPSSCTYTICPVKDNICKIRLDFVRFQIAGPEMTGNQRGVCATDSFQVTGTSGALSPIICGLNEGQHMYVDSTPDCIKLAFSLGDRGSSQRSWSIKTTQYDCDSFLEENDCLQYFTTTSGSFKSFGYRYNNGQHLNNNKYSVCFRQEKGNCQICFNPTIQGPPASFAVNRITNGPNTELSCTDDYIGVERLGPPTDSETNRICGANFNVVPGAPSATLCSSSVPFRWTVAFQEAGQPGAGFDMQFTQTACTS